MLGKNPSYTLKAKWQTISIKVSGSSLVMGATAEAKEGLGWERLACDKHFPAYRAV
jgi:hypothetical protein